MLLSHSESGPLLTSSPGSAAARPPLPRTAASSQTASLVPEHLNSHQHHLSLRPHLVSPGVEVHHQVLGLGISVPHLALVAVGVPGHLLRDVAVLLVLLEQLVVLAVLDGSGLERLSEDHRGLAGPGDGGRPRDGAVPGYGGIVLDAEERVGRIKVVVMDRSGDWAGGDTS